jgi:hypothetical protein
MINNTFSFDISPDCGIMYSVVTLFFRRQAVRKLVFICMYLSLTIPCAAATIYVSVSAGGANDGSSWADAYNYLQDALDDAAYSDNIWVAAGTYYPDTTRPDRSARGILPNGKRSRDLRRIPNCRNWSKSFWNSLGIKLRQSFLNMVT